MKGNILGNEVSDDGAEDAVDKTAAESATDAAGGSGTETTTVRGPVVIQCKCTIYGCEVSVIHCMVFGFVYSHLYTVTFITNN